MGSLNLGWGNPAFLSKYWQNKFRVTRKSSDGLLYDKAGGLDKLKDAIIALHNREKNAVVSNKHIVIANGATQAIQAALYALDGQSVGAVPPHYQKFPVHAKLAGKDWKKYSESDIAIITVPNNPDANDFGANLGHPNAIFDLCYNWSTYTDNVINFDKPIMIFGLSKALGMAGSRIGWAIVQDKAVADKMKEFVDCQTLGVSQDSQERATRSILYAATRKANALRYGEAVLKERWKKVIELGVPAVNKSGMFLWSKNPEYWKALDVVGIPGEAMGATNEYVRINLGCSDEDFEELLRRITNNLRK